MKPGDVFWCPDTGPAADAARAHLSVVLKVDGAVGDVFTVPIVSNRWGDRADWTLEPSEALPFIVHSSVLDFSNARKAPIEGVERLLRKRPSPGSLPEKTLAYALEALAASPVAPRSFRDAVLGVTPRRILPARETP